MLVLRVTKQKPFFKAKKSTHYIVGAIPITKLVGKQVRLRNLRKSKSIGTVAEVVEDVREVTEFGRGMIPKQIKVTLADNGISQWFCEKDILKVMS